MHEPDHSLAPIAEAGQPSATSLEKTGKRWARSPPGTEAGQVKPSKRNCARNGVQTGGPRASGPHLFTTAPHVGLWFYCET
jgi:hypothetical protein